MTIRVERRRRHEEYRLRLDKVRELFVNLWIRFRHKSFHNPGCPTLLAHLREGGVFDLHKNRRRAAGTRESKINHSYP